MESVDREDHRETDELRARVAELEAANRTLQYRNDNQYGLLQEAEADLVALRKDNAMMAERDEILLEDRVRAEKARRKAELTLAKLREIVPVGAKAMPYAGSWEVMQKVAAVLHGEDSHETV